MRRVRTLAALCATSVAFIIPTVASPAYAADNTEPRVLLTGLNSPKGLDLAGDLVIGQGAFGPPAPVLIYELRGNHRGETFPVTDPVSLVDVAVSPLDGTGWGIGEGDGGVFLFHQLQDGTIVPVLNITEYQAGDLDPHDQEGVPEESNPYGLAIERSGNALVADAAGNDLLRVTPEGEATTVARFDVQTISTDHLPPELGLPPTIDAEAVPTSIALQGDGSILVGELKGFPFRPGTSHVWKIAADSDGVLCSVNTPEVGCKVYRSGFTAIEDIAFRAGTLYVYEFAAGGVLAFEEGFDTGDFPPAVLLELKRGKVRELAAGHLSQPGGVAVNELGVFVTDGVFGDGRLLKVRR